MSKNKEKIISELRALIEDIERNDVQVSKFVYSLDTNDGNEGWGEIEIKFENAPIYS